MSLREKLALMTSAAPSAVAEDVIKAWERHREGGPVAFFDGCFFIPVSVVACPFLFLFFTERAWIRLALLAGAWGFLFATRRHIERLHANREV